MEKYSEWFISIIGGIVGWFIGIFEPTFPLIYVAVAFILYDSWTAFELDKRVKQQYPDKKKRPAKYVSYKAWDMIPTMIESFIIILLMFAAQKYIFVDLYVPLSYIATGAICGVQLLSIAENKSSCRFPGDKGYKIWKVLAKYLVDKTERHFDADLSELKEELDKIQEENIEPVESEAL
jgi:hypothetical protein